MKQHILIEKAKKYNPNDDMFKMENCTFNHTSGYWMINDTNEVLMLTNRAPQVMTKKCDRETGEDKKGE